MDLAGTDVGFVSKDLSRLLLGLVGLCTEANLL